MVARISEEAYDTKIMFIRVRVINAGGSRYPVLSTWNRIFSGWSDVIIEKISWENSQLFAIASFCLDFA